MKAKGYQPEKFAFRKRKGRCEQKLLDQDWKNFSLSHWACKLFKVILEHKVSTQEFIIKVEIALVEQS